MTTQVILVDAQGKRYDIPHSKVRWETYREGRASKLTVEAIGGDIPIYNGNRVVFLMDGTALFDGFVFAVSAQKQTLSFCGYDRLRYLLYKDSYIFYGKRLSDIAAQIVKDKGFRQYRIERTGKYIPQILADNQPLLSIIAAAIRQERRLGGGSYVFYDDAGTLTLRNREAMTVNRRLHLEENMVSFARNREIDTGTYNRIRLMQTDRAGQQAVYIKEDADSIGKYGVLQYAAAVDRDLLPSQVRARAEELLSQHREEKSSLLVTAVGHYQFRAGFVVQAKLRKQEGAMHYQIDEAVHTVEKGQHTMRLKLIR